MTTLACPTGCTLVIEGIWITTESIRKVERLLERESDHVRDGAIELDALVSRLPTKNSRQLAQMQVQASHKQAKELRQLARKVKEK